MWGNGPAGVLGSLAWYFEAHCGALLPDARNIIHATLLKSQYKFSRFMQEDKQACVGLFDRQSIYDRHTELFHWASRSRPPLSLTFQYRLWISSALSQILKLVMIYRLILD
jgi:hypothetical protein